MGILQPSAAFVGICRYWSGSEIRRIEGVQRTAVITPRILLRQQEGLGGLPVISDRREIDSGIETVTPAAGKKEPAAIATPVVQSLCLSAVHLIHAARFSRLQVQQPQVGLRMPYGEIAVIRLGVHQVAPVVGRPRPRHALICRSGIDQCIYLCSKSARRSIKTHTSKTVLLLVRIGGKDLPTGGDEVEPLAVRREGRCVLHPVFPHRQGITQNGMCLGVIDEYVG